MKLITIFFILNFTFTVSAQNITTGYWLPLKRLEQIKKFKIDRCDSTTEFPFKKIKFSSDKTISLFGFDAADPDACKLVPQKQKATWQIGDTVLNTLYPPFSKRSKITLKIRNDTLYVSLVNNSMKFDQKFVRKYENVKLINYNEQEVGNVFIKGKFVTSNKADTIQFIENGNIKIYSKKKSDPWKYTFFKFIEYSKECGELSESMRIIELLDNKRNRKRYLIKGANTENRIDFYEIANMRDRLTVGDVKFSFSLFRIG